MSLGVCEKVCMKWKASEGGKQLDKCCHAVWEIGKINHPQIL